MDARFTKCYPVIKAHEGGIGNPDQPTAYGVIQPTYDGWRYKQGLPYRHVYLIEVHERLAIYHDEFWIRTKCHKMFPGLNVSMFDMGVNAGQWVGKSLGLQALKIRRREGLLQVIKDYSALRLRHYRTLWNWPLWGNVWKKRTRETMHFALAMAGDSSELPVLQLKATPSRYTKVAQAWLGFSDEDCDGIFGNMTDRAVQTLQATNGLFVTGIIDSKTWDILAT